jgi:hypothetical protein
LRRGEQWETYARSLSLDVNTLATIDAVQRKATDRARISAENEAIRQNQRALTDTVSASVVDWLRAELEKVRSVLEQAGTHIVEVGKVTWPGNHFGFERGRSGMYIMTDGAQLAFVNTTDTFKIKFVLKFFICEARRALIQFGNDVGPMKAIDPQLALVPYIIELRPPDYRNGDLGGFLKSATAMARAHAEAARRMGSRHIGSGEPLIAKTFIGSPINLLVEFKASEWPEKLDDMRQLFSESVRMLVTYSDSSTRCTGP